MALLSEAGGNLLWYVLLDAYTFATHPKLMQKAAPQEEVTRVTAWAVRWKENIPSGLLLKSLDQLGGANLTLSDFSEGRVFSLLDGPRPPATPDVGYDAWLALRIAGSLPPQILDIPERELWTEQAEALTFV